MNKSIQFYGIFSKEVARFCKVPLQTLGAPIINAFLYLLIFGVSLGGSIDLDNNLPYLAFLIPGLIAMAIIKNAFDNSTSSIMGQKYMQELQDHRTTPLSLNQLCFARALASLARGLLVGFVTYLVGQGFYLFVEKKFLIIYDPLILIYFVTFGGLAFGLLGVAIAMHAKNFEHVGAVSMLVLLPLIYLGGVFFSLENAHTFWHTLSHFNPLYFIINGIRYGMLGTSDMHISLSFSITLGFFILCYILALMSLRKGSNYMR